MAKFTHIAKDGTWRPGSFNMLSKCGRMVNMMTGIASPEEATCTKCLAEHLVEESAKPEEAR